MTTLSTEVMTRVTLAALTTVTINGDGEHIVSIGGDRDRHRP